MKKDRNREREREKEEKKRKRGKGTVKWPSMGTGRLLYISGFKSRYI